MSSQADAPIRRRRHVSGDTVSVASYSACDRYRYRLARVWQAELPRVAFVMLNPSTATERRNDPTIERCERRARAMGFGGLEIVNLFAWRATDPQALRRVRDPVGSGNDRAILRAARRSGLVIAGWGVHGSLLGRGSAVARQLALAGVRLHHLGLSKEGHPRHPLYVPYRQGPEVWPVLTN